MTKGIDIMHDIKRQDYYTKFTHDCEGICFKLEVDETVIECNKLLYS